jgi:cell division protein FtsW (lipid II flippase)
MPKLQNLPESHTDFIFSVDSDAAGWILVFLVLVCVGAVVAVVRYRRRHRH